MAFYSNDGGPGLRNSVRRSSCATPQHHPSNEQKIQTALSTVDAELDSLGWEEAPLRSALVSLKVARNQSKALTPVHTLPPEILASIFLTMHQNSSSYYYDYEYSNTFDQIPPAQALTGTCSYWRQLAIGTSLLWADIKITTSQTCYHSATLSLSRTNGLPIYLAAMEPDPDDLDENRSWDRAHGLYAFLEQACRQIGRLDIYSFARLNHATDVVLEHWLDHCPAGMTRVLQVQRYCATLGFIGPPPTNWRLQLAYIEHAESVVESLSVLQLRDTLIPWTSLAYHNRIDLRLYYGSSPATVKISVSQFANILNSSPELTRLQLEGLEITPSDGWNATMAVHLVHLEVLYLNDLRGESYKLLASIILLSDCLNDLSASLHIRGVPGSQEPQRTTDLIRDFFRDINVKTLMCSEEHLRSIENPQWAWSLPTTVVSLDTLVLTNFGLLGETALQAMLYGNQTNVDEPKALKQIVPHLPHLFMDRCKVNIEELNIIVSAHGVRDINLRECTIYNTENSGYPEDMVALRNELLTAFPELICTVWSDDIAAEWPRCKIYD